MDQKKLLLEVMTEMGASPQQLQQKVQRQPTLEKAREALSDLKEEAKKRYKKLAFQWHPDRNPDDPTATARFKLLGQVMEGLEKIELRPRPTVHVVQFYPQRSPFGGTATSTSTSWWSPVTPTSTSSVTSRPTTGYDARRVVFIRMG